MPDSEARPAAPWDLLGTAALLSFGAASHPCQVEHLTAGGALLRCAQHVTPWTVATLRVEHFGKFHCRVLWQRADSIGVQFLDSARATIQLAASA